VGESSLDSEGEHYVIRKYQILFPLYDKNHLHIGDLVEQTGLFFRKVAYSGMRNLINVLDTVYHMTDEVQKASATR
jgi:hypothetical protein